MGLTTVPYISTFPRTSDSIGSSMLFVYRRAVLAHIYIFFVSCVFARFFSRPAEQKILFFFFFFNLGLLSALVVYVEGEPEAGGEGEPADGGGHHEGGQVALRAEAVPQEERHATQPGHG